MVQSFPVVHDEVLMDFTDVVDAWRKIAGDFPVFKMERK
jgi:hypothetical protein